MSAGDPEGSSRTTGVWGGETMRFALSAAGSFPLRAQSGTKPPTTSL